MHLRGNYACLWIQMSVIDWLFDLIDCITYLLHKDKLLRFLQKSIKPRPRDRWLVSIKVMSIKFLPIHHLKTNNDTQKTSLCMSSK